MLTLGFGKPLQREARIDRGAQCVSEEAVRPIATKPPADFPTVGGALESICQGQVQFAAVVHARTVRVVVTASELLREIDRLVEIGLRIVALLVGGDIRFVLQGQTDIVKPFE